jgi:hypothetical protein
VLLMGDEDAEPARPPPAHTINAGGHYSDGQMAVSMAVCRGSTAIISIKNRMLQLRYI